MEISIDSFFGIKIISVCTTSCAKQLCVTWKFPLETPCDKELISAETFVQTNGHYVELHIEKRIGEREWEENIVNYMEISIDTLWQRISETILVQAVKRRLKISIHSGTKNI